MGGLSDTEKVLMASKPFVELLNVVVNSHSDGWVERKGRDHVLFRYNDFDFTMGMLLDIKQASDILEKKKSKENVFERIDKYLEENKEAAKASWDEVSKEYEERFETFKNSLTIEQRNEILEGYAEENLYKHCFGPPALEYLRDVEISSMFRELLNENRMLKERLEGDKFERQGR